jgi:hypothetical protein
MQASSGNEMFARLLGVRVNNNDFLVQNVKDCFCPLIVSKMLQALSDLPEMHGGRQSPWLSLNGRDRIADFGDTETAGAGGNDCTGAQFSARWGAARIIETPG